MKQALFPSAFAVLAALLPACAPFPATTPVFPRIQGSVVDAQTGKPIAAARVTAERAGYTRKAVTSTTGAFTLPPASQHHYLIYLGSPGVAPTPWHLRSASSSLTLTASAPGYQTTTQSYESRKEHPLPLNLPETIQIPLRR
ncbi:carboxypeptidase-like regulatory domain-containing protein [Verrucomicrobium sp. BvORR106]|uniref:carboxypeptidase-like regulatory domain-containing protein n=1 Tax=Verrucomicrobium sp. BvORR106 TaxID=1403819 RepID=UPI00056EEECF|nr:carboxypeptidase-like regulatory domain-containing protein [Verrucomicrobium sp. BvORR106]